MPKTYIPYSQESLMQAIFHLLPTYKEASGMGAQFNAPALLKVVSEKFFVDHFNGQPMTEDELASYQICHSAYSDLESGSFKFST
ncbi:hypothetical protein [Vibrio owensii]|uniref:hypothetical protein n=1 Tax=Vibrio harveyi group TaxID=717610 RepID=UPI003CC5BE95